MGADTVLANRLTANSAESSRCVRVALVAQLAVLPVVDAQQIPHGFDKLFVVHRILQRVKGNPSPNAACGTGGKAVPCELGGGPAPMVTTSGEIGTRWPTAQLPNGSTAPRSCQRGEGRNV